MRKYVKLCKQLNGWQWQGKYV